MAVKIRSLDFGKVMIRKRKPVEFFKIQCDISKFVQYTNNTAKCILNHKPYLP